MNSATIPGLPNGEAAALCRVHVSTVVPWYR